MSTNVRGNSSVFWDLVRHGPQSNGELELSGGISPDTRRIYDIRKFHPRPGPSGTRSTFGTTKCVYYLNEYHDPKDVIRKWLKINRSQIDRAERANARALTQHLSGDFKEAWIVMINTGEVSWLPGSEPKKPAEINSGLQTRTCPFCGKEEITYHAHIPRCTETG